MVTTLSGNCRSFPNRRPFTPSAHQNRAADLLSQTNNRGLLFYHNLGSGKTCTSILAADILVRTKGNGIKQVHVFTPGSLRSNFISEYCSLCGKRPQTFKKRYNFWTYNASNITKTLEEVDLNNSVIIVDEVHKVISEYLHKAPRGVYLYNRFLRATNVKIMLLSATPVRQSPIEVAYIANLLVAAPQNGFGTLKSDFTRYITGEFGNMKIVDGAALSRKLYGLISYVPSAGLEFYPELIRDPRNIYYTRMSRDQYNVYLLTRTKENTWRNISDDSIKMTRGQGRVGFANKLKGLRTMGWNRTVSRRAGNILVPNNLETIGYTYENPYSKKFQDIYYGNLDFEAETVEGITQKEQKNAPKETLMVLKDVAPRGWITEKYIKKIKDKWSAKYFKLLENVVRLPGKHAIYAENKERGGVYFIQALLQSCSIPCLVYAGGLTDSQRKGIVGAFNTPQNDDGHLIRAFIFTSAGMTGISLLTTRHLHQMDPISSPVEQLQFEGRVVRYKGHERLPPNERNVTLHQYLSVVPEFTLKDEESVQISYNSDMEMFYRAKNGMNDLEMLNDLLKMAAVDCTEYFPADQCYSPTGPPPVEVKVPGTVKTNTDTPFQYAKESLILYGLYKGITPLRMPNKGSVALMKKYTWARPTKKGKIIPDDGQYVRVAPEPTEDYIRYAKTHTIIKKGIDTLIWGFIVGMIDKPTPKELDILAEEIEEYGKETRNKINSIAIYAGDQKSLGSFASSWVSFARKNNITVTLYTTS